MYKNDLNSSLQTSDKFENTLICSLINNKSQILRTYFNNQCIYTYQPSPRLFKTSWLSFAVIGIAENDVEDRTYFRISDISETERDFGTYQHVKNRTGRGMYNTVKECTTTGQNWHWLSVNIKLIVRYILRKHKLFNNFIISEEFVTFKN